MKKIQIANKNNFNQNGFALAALLVVITILAIISIIFYTDRLQNQTETKKHAEDQIKAYEDQVNEQVDHLKTDLIDLEQPEQQ